MYPMHPKSLVYPFIYLYFLDFELQVKEITLQEIKRTGESKFHRFCFQSPCVILH